MPNHVYNTIEFTGGTRALNKIMKKVSMLNRTSNSKSEFDFNNLITPSDTEWYHKDDNWYNWNIANWGTKWNAYDVVLNEAIDNDHPFLGYTFTTAWSPPTGVMLALVDYMVEQRLDVYMDWCYEEEQGWGGRMHYDMKNGLNSVEEWEIPENHDEMVERRGECYCDEEYKPFSDCPVGEEE